MTVLKKIGEGVTADVYLLDGGKVLKLFNQNYSKEAVDYEAAIACEISRIGLPAPAVYGVEQHGNQYGIVYEYIDGTSMFDVLLTSKNRKEVISELADTQFRITRASSGNLPAQTARFEYQINNTGLDEQTKQALISWLKKIPEQNYVCHGDYHVGNIIKVLDKENGGTKLVVLDWMNCCRGNYEADFIRSILMLETPFIPMKLNPLKKIMFLIMKKNLARQYKKEILCRVEISNYKIWQTICAAVRLNDNIPGEEKWLKRMIKKNIKLVCGS